MNDNKYDVLIAKLQKEIRQLSNDQTARLLRQDGKLAELYAYLKESLINSIRSLLADMEFSGELDKIISETLLTGFEVLRDNSTFTPAENETGVVNDSYVYGHIKRYGAKGDGVTDDTEAIKAAAANAAALGYPLNADEGTYIIKEDLDLRGIKTVDFKGVIKTDNVITAGNRSADGSGCEIHFRTVPKLKIVGLKNSNVSFTFCTDLHLFADGDNPEIASIGYCTFSGAYCKNIVIEAVGSSIAWVNENVFRIKRVEQVTFTGDWRSNNNRFEHCNFEKGILNLNASRNNYFSGRCEGGVTVNTGEMTDTNFIEKEYYYSHYFGDDLNEYGGNSIAYYKINELQTERELLKIDANNRHFPIGALTFNAYGTFNGAAYNAIYHSNLIPIDHIFAIKTKASAKCFRVQMNFYDANKNRIMSEVDNFGDGKMKYWPSGTWSYTIAANVDNDTVTFYPGRAKYVEFQVIFGDASITATDLEFIKIKLVKLVGTDVHISDKLTHDVYTSVPTSGYWLAGQRLYAKLPQAGAYLGIVCVESGAPGVWKNFAPVKE